MNQISDTYLLQKRIKELEQVIENQSIEIQLLKTQDQSTRTESDSQVIDYYRSLFDESPISIWHEDISELTQYLDYLKSTGIKDFESYFAANESEIMNCISKIKVLDVNKKTLEILQFDSKEELIASLPNVFTSKTLDSFRFAVINLANRVPVFEAESEHKTKQGEIKALLIRNFVIGREYKDFSHVLVTMTDITEKKVAEFALNHSESKFKMLFEQMVSGFALHKMIYDADGNPIDYLFLEVNPAYEQLTGLKRDNIIGRTVLEVIPNLEPFWIETYGRVAKTGENVHFENYVKDLKKYFEVVAYQSRKDCFAVIINDITERKLAAQKLQKSEQRLRLTLEATNDAIWEYDLETGEKLFNKQFFNLFGFPTDNYQKEGFRESLIHPDDIDQVRKSIEHSKQSFVYEPIEYRIRTISGNYIWVLSRGKICVENDIPKRIIGTLIDITKLKEAQDEILSFNDELAAQNIHLEELNFELNRAKIRAEESDRLKSIFLKNLSHEIRTPMNGIIGFTDLLSNEELSPEKKISYLQKINSSTYQLLHTLDNMITISHIEAGQITIRRTEFSLNQFFNELHQFYQFEKISFNRSNVEIRLRVPIQLQNIKITSDYTNLKLVFTNLIDNALKFTHSGFVEFGCRYTKRETIEFYVKDTGIGIPADKQEVIFRRFSQADDKIRITYGGIGLGLAISNGVVRLLGSKLNLESKENYGTVFHFEFEHKQLNISNLIPQINSLNPNKIPDWSDKILLVAEDEQTNFFYIETLLENTRIQIIHAENGRLAVEFCQTGLQFDLILMDIKMPEMDGFQALKELKILGIDTPVIAQTAYAHERESCFDAGFNEYITKPFNTLQLVQIMSKFI